MTSLAFIIGYAGSSIPLLSKILYNESKQNAFDFIVTTPLQAEKHKKYLEYADAIFVYASNLTSSLEDSISKSKAKIVISASNSTVHLSKGPIDLAVKATKFYKFGGEHNFVQLVRLLLKTLGYQIEVGELKDIPWHGIWHPDYGTFTNIDNYLNAYPYNNRELVGILFYRSIWLYENSDFITPLIRALENEGIGVIPVFTYSFGDSSLGAPNSEISIQNFFMREERSLIHVLINLTSFFLLKRQKIKNKSERFKVIEGIELLKTMNIPILQAIRDFSKSVEEWLSDRQGIGYLSQIYTVIMPEVDGLIEPIYYGGTQIDSQGIKRYESFNEHARYIARRAKRWINLRQKPLQQRKIAIVLITPPCKSLEASIGVGFGLDVPESIVRILHNLKKSGYNVGKKLPEKGKELLDLILEKKAISEFRWTSVEEIVNKGGAVGYVDLETYMKWYEELPQKVREKLKNDWHYPKEVLLGTAPKQNIGMVFKNKFVIPGIEFGNVLVITQPKPGCAGAACDGKVCKILHDPNITPPHQWLATYRWITRVWKADVIVHFGTHGYLEFRAGKGVGLSPSCWPEISIDDVPHLYVYNVSNPMEGVIAKRRSYATIIDHIYPPLAMAEVLDDVNMLLTEYSKAKQLGDKNRAEIIYKSLINKTKEHNIPITKKEPSEVVEEIHHYLSTIMGTQIEMGLHVFGYPVNEPSKLAEYVVTTMCYDTHSFPSIRRCLANFIGLDYKTMREKKLETNKLGLTNKDTLQLLHKVAIEVLKGFIESKTNIKLSKSELVDVITEVLERNLGNKIAKINLHSPEEIQNAFNRALEIANKIKECKVEMESFLKGVKGSFIDPSASGSITRGKIEILPTGKNFYAIDPASIPTRAAWEIGVETANLLIKHYMSHHGKYPESTGHWLWSLDGYKGDGEQISQILYLLGTRPIWRSDGTIKGVEVISLEELKRPRIDVTVRISGIVRDTLPNYFQLIDEAVSKVINLNEPIEMNFVKKHYLEFLKELGEKEQYHEAAKCRVWCSPPGTYGTGVNYAIESSGWKSNEDLAKTWIQWGCYMYTKSSFGKPSPESLILNLKKVDVVTRNHLTDEHDILNCCCYFSYHGGFYNTVKSITGKENLEIVVVDTKDITKTEIREMKKEIERISRAKLLNPVWIKEMKKHGYRGANEFSKKILHLYGWSSTTNLVDNWIFDKIVETYIIDEEMRKWFENNNIWAAEEIARRLVEASERGLWQPSEEIKEKLGEVYAEIEGILEESMGTESDIQGGEIRIINSEEVENWKSKLSNITQAWEKIVKKTKKNKN